MAYRISDVKTVASKAKSHTVEYLYKDQYKVTSASSGRFYVVTVGKNRCTCDRQRYIGKVRNNMVNGCSHVQSVLAFKNSNYKMVARKSSEDTSHLHRKTFNELKDDGVIMTGRKI